MIKRVGSGPAVSSGVVGENKSNDDAGGGCLAPERHSVEGKKKERNVDGGLD